VHPLLDYKQEPHCDWSDWQYHDLRLVDSDSEEEGELPSTSLWQAVAHILMPDLAAGFQGWSAEDHTGVHLALGAAESRLRLVTTLDARSVPRTVRQTEVIWIIFGGSTHFAAPQLDRGDHIPESSDESDLDEMPNLVPPGLASFPRPLARAPEE
jgi:hypothetical protein